MISNKYPMLFIALCFFALLLMQSFPAYSQQRILVLNSYHEGFHWTDRIMSGVKSVFDQQDDVELFINYMDTKRHAGDDYFQQLRDLYASKYQFVKFDAIISSDDLALDFLLKYRDELFPGVPVIFSGLNDFTPDRLAGADFYTGVYESYDVVGTIELMLELHPDAQVINSVIDGSRSGLIFQALIKKAEAKFAGRVNFNYLSNLPPNALKKALGDLPEKSLVLWAIYLRMPSGESLSVKESVGLVAQNSRFPTYCIWDVVGYGVVGGKITSPNFQGETAAKMALNVLQGEPVANIPVVGSSLANIFDFKALQRFDIALGKLPETSIVMNKPNSFYDLYKRYIWMFSIIIFLLITIIVFLITIILLKRKRDKFEGMAMHDQLTGLYNRYYLHEVAEQKISEAIRHQQPLCLLVLDIDHFKVINDKHGHLIGDQVLQDLALLLDKTSRSGDVVARFGGEEFVILISHCGLIEAEEKAQHIRESVSSLCPRGLVVTVSIGLAELGPNESVFSELLDRADIALFQAKTAGRNCVVVAPSLE